MGDMAEAVNDDSPWDGLGEQMQTFVYVLECSDGTLYTGWTSNLWSRLDKHNAGKGAKYTRGRLPARLVWFETWNSRGCAMRREAQIKRLPRAQKRELVAMGVLK